MGTTQQAEAVHRLVGLLVPRPSVLRRGSDRVEVAARWVLLLVGLLFVPVALSVGSDVAASHEVTAATQRGERHQVAAQVLAPPEETFGARPDVVAGEVRAPVRWIAADGTVRVALVRVPRWAQPGDPRPMWVDRDDRPTSAPPAPSESAGQGVLTALLLVVGDLVVSLFLLAVLGWVLDRARLRAWEKAWRRFTGPDHQSTR